MNALFALLATASPQAVLLFDLRPVGGEKKEAALYTARLAELLEAESGKPVLTRGELNALVSLDEARQVLACEDDASCVARTSLKDRFKRVITGSIGRVGAQWVLNASLLDAETAEPVARAGVAARSLAELERALPEAARALLGKSETTTSSAAAVLPDQRFVVLDLEAAGVSKEVASNLTEVVALELKRVRGATVLSQEDIRALVGTEQLKSVLSDECDTACFSEIAGALDARYLLVGRVGRLESTCVVSLTLLEQSKELRDHRRAHEAFRGDETELLRAVRHATRSLVGLAGGGEGQIAVSASEVGADVFVDHQRIGTLPLPPRRDAAGRHSITVAKDGYYSFQTDVYVSPEETTAVWAELKAEPEPWYQKWWVWTIVGVTIAAGTTAAIVATRPDPQSGVVALEFE